MDATDQRSRIAKTQRQWAAMALRDATYNLQQARRDHTQHNPLLEQMHIREAELDFTFAQWRLNQARKQSRY